MTSAQESSSPTVWSYVYDDAGRLSEILPDGAPGQGARRYTYNAAGLLVRAEGHDGAGYQPQAEMAYNGLGERVQMTGWARGQSATTSYALDLASPKAGPLSATSLNNTTFYLYARGKPVAEQVVGWSYYLNDGLNVPRQMSDAAGVITLEREYTPWGEVLKQAGTGNFTWGYFGGLMDAATGLLYVGGGQYYDPATGRFLTPANRGSGNPYLPGRVEPLGAVLAPVALAALFLRRKKKAGKYDMLVVVAALALGLGVGLAACGGGDVTPTNTCTPPSLPPVNTVLPTTEITHTPEPTKVQTPTADPTKCNNGYGCTAYLTFDDGPDEIYTPQIALYLQQQLEPVQATFFLVGADFKQSEGGWINPDDPANVEYKRVDLNYQNVNVVRYLDNLGHAIGIHGWMHPTFQGNDPIPFLAWDHNYFKNYLHTLNNEVADIENLIGKPLAPLLMRAPGGYFAKEQFSNWGDSPFAPRFQGAYYYGWDVASPGGSDGENVVRTILAKLGSRALPTPSPYQSLPMPYPDNIIILMHPSVDSGDYDAITKFNLLEELRNRGYTQFRALPRNDAESGYPPKGYADPDWTQR